MKKFIDNSRGISLLYVMAALIMAGFVGSALMKMSHHSAMASTMYDGSESARSAVNAGFYKAIARLEDEINPNGIVAILQTWVNSGNPNNITGSNRWLTPDENGAYTGGYLPLSDGLEYRAQMVGFDRTTFDVLIKSESRGANGSSASAIGAYRIDGLEYGSQSNWDDENALHIEDGIKFWMRGPITINGGARFSNDVQFDEWASGSVFNGKFRTQDSETSKMEFKGIYTFNGNSYFGTKPFWGWRSVALSPAQVMINKKAGFPEGDTISVPTIQTAFNSYVNITDESYWLKSPKVLINTTKAFHHFNKKNLHHLPGGITAGTYYTTNGGFAPMYSYQDSPPTYQDYSDLDKDKILGELGFLKDPCKITLHPEVIPSGCINDITGYLEVSATSLDNMAFSNPKWGDFTVIRIQGEGNQLAIRSGGTLTGKYIILVGTKGVLQPPNNGSAFDVTVAFDNGDVDKDNSGNFTIINNGGIVNNIGGWSTFRGLFYNILGNMVIGGSQNTGLEDFYGSIYGKGGVVQWYPQPTADSKVHFDPTVYEELEKLVGTEVNGNNKLLTKSGLDCSTGSTNTTTLVLTAPSLTAEVLSRTY